MAAANLWWLECQISHEDRDKKNGALAGVANDP